MNESEHSTGLRLNNCMVRLPHLKWKKEGINIKIKIMKRDEYGFRNERCFNLRLYAQHDCRIILPI